MRWHCITAEDCPPVLPFSCLKFPFLKIPSSTTILLLVCKQKTKLRKMEEITWSVPEDWQQLIPDAIGLQGL